jgi:pimeloyl-ACP methyl ester carboxylesterase
MDELTRRLGITNYVLFMQDYGGPVDFRMALSRPERVRAVIILNAVSHEQGLSPLCDARRKYWADPAHQLTALRANFTSSKRRASAISDRATIRIVTIRIHGRTSTPFSPALAKPTFKRRCFSITGPMLPPIRAGRSGSAKYRSPTPVVWGKYDPAFTVAGTTAHAGYPPGGTPYPRSGTFRTG